MTLIPTSAAPTTKMTVKLTPPTRTTQVSALSAHPTNSSARMASLRHAAALPVIVTMSTAIPPQPLVQRVPPCPLTSVPLGMPPPLQMLAAHHLLATVPRAPHLNPPPSYAAPASSACLTVTVGISLFTASMAPVCNASTKPLARSVNIAIMIPNASRAATHMCTQATTLALLTRLCPSLRRAAALVSSWMSLRGLSS